VSRLRAVQFAALAAIAMACSTAAGREQKPRPAKTMVSGGSAVTGFDQVLYLESAKCSAVMIATDVIVTADHCAVAPKQEVKNDTGTVAHTDALVGGPSSYGLELWSLIAITGVTLPSPLSGDTTDLKNGEPILAIGYGETNLGAKLALAGTVHDKTCPTSSCMHQPSWVGEFSTSGGGLCVGDSGGAAFTTTSGTYRLAGIMIGALGITDHGGCATKERMATLDTPTSDWLADRVKIYRQSKGPAGSRE